MRINCVRVAVASLLMLATTSTLGAGDNPKQRPFGGQLKGEAIMYPSEECSDYLGLQTATAAQGSMLHLGLTEMLATHCPTAEFTNENGEAKFTAANGDEVWATYTAWTLEPPPDVVQEVYMVIDGGTGRFEGALGFLEGLVYVRVEDYNVQPWPIKLDLTGKIVF